MSGPMSSRIWQERWRPLVVTAIFTGLRTSELRGLQWGDVDLDAAELTVRQRADRWGSIGSPKSDAGQRAVPLAPMVVNALREWHLACPMGVGDLVFPNGKGRPEQITSIHYRGLGPLERTAGITDDEKPKYGMRSLRQARHNRRVGLCGNVPSYGASSAIMGLSRAGAFLPCRARHHA